MKPVYVDTSVMVALLLQEPGYKIYQRILSAADQVLSSYLLEAEFFSTARRENISLDFAQEIIASVALVMPGRSLIREYRRLFDMGYCRGGDAFHLATALYLDPSVEQLRFLSADKPQAKIAEALGFKPEKISIK